MEVLDQKINLETLEKYLNELSVPGNDFRPDLLVWLNERVLDKGSFMNMYPKEKTIGRGASSTIYKSGNKTVRVSGDIKDAGSTVLDLNRFRVETEIMENLQGSDYIVRLIDTFVVGSATCHIMEYADAGSLKDHIPEKGMLVEDALACMYQLFQGLDFVHSNDIIHYDIKPANVLVYTNGRLKLTDFDISLRVDNGTVIDDWGDSVKNYIMGGSVPYMAPEVLKQGEIENVEDMFKLDVFSAGRTFLHLITNDDFLSQNPRVIILETLEKDNITSAIRIEKKVKGKSCKRCASMFRYTLQRDKTLRKPAAWILQRMESWTWRPGRFGFNEEKSIRVVRDMLSHVQLRF